MKTRLLLTAIAIALAAPAARAQAPTELPHAVLSANVGAQAPSRSFTDTFTFDQYVETAQVQADYAVKVKAFFDGGAAVRLWRSVGAGVAVSRFTDTRAAAVTGTVPHPFFFDRDRTITGAATGVARNETAVHVQIVAFVPAGRRWLLELSAGPTFLSVEQGFVTGVSYDESYPFDTATYRSATVQKIREHKAGYNVGGDVTFRLTPSIGLGAIVRYSRARVGFDVNGARLDLDAGGLQAGGGMRVLF